MCRGRAFGSEARRLDLDPGAEFHDVEHLAEWRVLVEVDAKWPPHMIGDKGAYPLAGDHQMVGAQRRHCFPNDSAADARCGYHFLLGRQP